MGICNSKPREPKVDIIQERVTQIPVSDIDAGKNVENAESNSMHVTNRSSVALNKHVSGKGTTLASMHISYSDDHLVDQNPNYEDDEFDLKHVHDADLDIHDIVDPHEEDEFDVISSNNMIDHAIADNNMLANDSFWKKNESTSINEGEFQMNNSTDSKLGEVVDPPKLATGIPSNFDSPSKILDNQSEEEIIHNLLQISNKGNNSNKDLYSTQQQQPSSHRVLQSKHSIYDQLALISTADNSNTDNFSGPSNTESVTSITSLYETNTLNSLNSTPYTPPDVSSLAISAQKRQDSITQATAISNEYTNTSSSSPMTISPIATVTTIDNNPFPKINAFVNKTQRIIRQKSWDGVNQPLSAITTDSTSGSNANRYRRGSRSARSDDGQEMMEESIPTGSSPLLPQYTVEERLRQSNLTPPAPSTYNHSAAMVTQSEKAPITAVSSTATTESEKRTSEMVQYYINKAKMKMKGVEDSADNYRPNSPSDLSTKLLTFELEQKKARRSSSTSPQPTSGSTSPTPSSGTTTPPHPLPPPVLLGSGDGKKLPSSSLSSYSVIPPVPPATSTSTKPASSWRSFDSQAAAAITKESSTNNMNKGIPNASRKKSGSFTGDPTTSNHEVDSSRLSARRSQMASKLPSPKSISSSTTTTVSVALSMITSDTSSTTATATTSESQSSFSPIESLSTSLDSITFPSDLTTTTTSTSSTDSEMVSPLPLPPISPVVSSNDINNNNVEMSNKGNTKSNEVDSGDKSKLLLSANTSISISINAEKPLNSLTNISNALKETETETDKYEAEVLVQNESSINQEDDEDADNSSPLPSNDTSPNQSVDPIFLKIMTELEEADKISPVVTSSSSTSTAHPGSTTNKKSATNTNATNNTFKKVTDEKALSSSSSAQTGKLSQSTLKSSSTATASASGNASLTTTSKSTAPATAKNAAFKAVASTVISNSTSTTTTSSGNPVRKSLSAGPTPSPTSPDLINKKIKPIIPSRNRTSTGGSTGSGNASGVITAAIDDDSTVASAVSTASDNTGFKKLTKSPHAHDNHGNNNDASKDHPRKSVDSHNITSSSPFSSSTSSSSIPPGHKRAASSSASNTKFKAITNKVIETIKQEKKEDNISDISSVASNDALLSESSSSITSSPTPLPKTPPRDPKRELRTSSALTSSPGSTTSSKTSSINSLESRRHSVQSSSLVEKATFNLAKKNAASKLIKLSDIIHNADDDVSVTSQNSSASTTSASKKSSSTSGTRSSAIPTVSGSTSRGVGTSTSKSKQQQGGEGLGSDATMGHKRSATVSGSATGIHQSRFK